MSLRAWCLLLLFLVAGVPVCAAGTFTLPVFPPTVMVCSDGEVVALQPLLELCGGKAVRDLHTGSISITCAGRTLTCFLRSTKALDGDRKITLPCAPFERRQVIFVPVRPLIAVWGGTVAAGKAEGTLAITLPLLKSSLILPTRVLEMPAGAYTCNNSELYLMNLDGSGLRRITYSTGNMRLPDFSPDGRWIAYTFDGGLYVRRVNETIGTCLLAARHAPNQHTLFLSPTFTATGKILYLEQEFSDYGYRQMIRYDNDYTGNSRIGIINPDGTGQRTLVENGRQLRLSSDRKMAVYNIFPTEMGFIDAEGVVTHSKLNGWNADFSPDGTRLAYCAYGTNGWTLQIYRLKGPSRLR